MDPLQVFENFKLDTLDEKWSDEVWEKEFLSFPEPPGEYSILLGSEDMESLLKDTSRALKNWIAQNKEQDEIDENQRSEVSWQTFTAVNVNIKGLLAVLGYLIKTGLAAGADEDSRQACLASASLYFTLLGIPGSSTYQIFHPNLYQRAINTLKLSEHLLDVKEPRYPDLESLYLDDPPETMLRREKTTLVKGLNSILFELITMLKSFYMKYQLNSLEITIMNLVDLTKIESDVNVLQSNVNKKVEASKASLCYNAYVALMDLCEPRHGVVEDVIRLILKYFMPHLCSNYLDLPFKAVSVIWDTIVQFVKNLLTIKESLAELSVEILIQHLFIQCPDRSEPRQKQALVISKLINICEEKLYFKNIKNLIEFAFHNRIPYRIFAQEIITKLLIDAPSDRFIGREKAKVTLTAAVFSRTNDCSSMVRGKAMSIIESIINSPNWTVNEFLDLADNNKKIATVEDLVKSLEEEDFNPLPGPNTLNNILLGRIKDERALVRRSAMHAFQNLVTHFPTLLDMVIPTIGQHTRDPALTVRKDAIGVLENLLQKHPSNQKLLGEFIKTVLPRIYDVETKVQEKVLESLQNLMLNNIILFETDIHKEINHLPWKLLRKITEEKLRKNLSRICDSWVKNDIITDRLVSKIQSYIGTEHDTEAWVLLLALVENKSLPNMDKYFENYNNIIGNDDFVTVLKLEVLRHSWKSMKKDYIKNLSVHIYECLSKFNVSLESISICIDILDGITKKLQGPDAENLTQSQVINLMRISEHQIEQLSEKDQEIKEENINVYLKAMNILGHVSFLCSEDVSESTLSIIQSLLLDCDSIQASSHCKEKLKAAGIVILGQQALRDRDIAEEAMPILGQLMCKSSASNSLIEAAIKINSVKALADLCIRFTALVEPYLPDMCICMKDSNANVRETIVIIFVQLLLEDYIKVKGSFFYHILTMLSDTEETIRDLTVFLIKERLLIKNKTLISQSFVTSIFHYNNCPTKHKFNERKIRKKEKDALTLPGQENQTKRRVIYDFMIDHLDPPSKLKIITKLHSEVLEGVCEKFISIKNKEGAGVLKDVLYILSNDRMQVLFSNKTQDEDLDETTVAIENATNKAINVIIEGIKRFKLKIMIPTVIKLKQFLLNCKSPLLTDVSKFFIKIISDFNKDQLTEIYDEYPDLKKEVDRDISIYGKKLDGNSSDSNSDEEQQHVNINVAVDVEITSARESSPENNLAQSSTKIKSNSSTPRKISDVSVNGLPRIVLRRLSTLTYPGIKGWKSPPQESKNSLSSDPEPSSSGISVSSKSPTDDTNLSSPDFSETELCSTPKPCKISRLSKETDSFQNL